MRIKCITFDKAAQDNLPKHIKDKMKADREKSRERMNADTEKYKGISSKKPQK